jgi:hypothetical protein
LTTDPTLSSGETVLLTAGGFAPFEEVDVTLHSTEIALGAVAADSTGIVNYSFTVPAGLPAGTHHVEFAGTSQDPAFAFTITAAAGTTSSSSGGLSSTGFDTTLFGGLGAALIAAGGLVALRGRPRLAALRGRHAR